MEQQKKLYGQQYDVKGVDVAVDVENKKVVNKEDVSPFELIKSLAEKNGTKIEKPNPSCHYCYGRGYVGIDIKSTSPVPCACIFRGRTENERKEQNLTFEHNRPLNRLEKRKMMKNLKKINTHSKKIAQALVSESVNKIVTAPASLVSIDEAQKLIKESV
jgi:hypothetical protein